MSDVDEVAPIEETLARLSPEMREAVETAHARAAAAGYVEPEPSDESHWTSETYEPAEPTDDGLPVCVYCRSSIPSTLHAYRRVVAWERKRRQGGTNAVRLRETLDEWACGSCVDAIAAGRSPAQGAIL